MAASKEPKQRPRFRTSITGDVSVHSCSLEFDDPRSEQGYASAILPRLARSIRNFMCVWMFFATFKLVISNVSDMSGEDDLDSELYQEARLASLLVDLAIVSTGGILFCASLIQLRRPMFTLRQLEVFLVVTFVMIMILGPFVPLRHARRVFLQREEVIFEGDTDAEWMVLLLFDVISTMVSLMPARFSSIWVIYLFTVIWFPLSRVLFIGSENPERAITQSFAAIGLTCMAMLGKIMMEFQERRLFFIVANERTLRAQSEFQLSQQQQGDRDRRATGRSEVSAAVHSHDTADIFDPISTADSADIKATLRRVRRLAKQEHWLLEAQDIRLNITKLLGRGGFGAVVTGFMHGLPVAVKVPLDQMSSEGVKRISAMIGEVRILRKLRHPNIVSFHGAIIDPDFGEVAVVLEFASGPCLTEFIAKAQLPLSDEQLYRISASTACALQYLHGHKPAIVHADLKPSNIMLEIAGSAASRVKLVDFGLSRILKGQVSRLGGTLSWKAPELLASSSIVPNTSVDMYGLGRIMLFVLSGEYPFLGWSRPNIREALLAGKVPGMEPTPSSSSDVNMYLWKLGKLCASVNPSSRPPTVQVCSQLRGLAASSSMRIQLSAAATEIWGWCEAGPSEPSRISMPWDQALPKLRQMLRQQRVEPAERQETLPLAPMQQAQLAALSSSSSSSLPSSSVIAAAAQDEQDAASKLTPIIEGAEESRSQQGSRARTVSKSQVTSNSSSTSSNSVPEGKADADMSAALGQVFGTRTTL